jgi:undecaprenyl-diphosphatase
VSLLGAISLGVIQGLTEFLPVSSSGHLAVAQHFLPGFHQPGVLFDIVLHLGTLAAVLIYFRSEVMLLALGFISPKSGATGRRLTALLALATLPAVLVGLTLGDLVERSFTELTIVGIGLLLTGGLLLVSPRISRESRPLERVSAADALAVGFLQSAALVPGISRSGSTIVAGLARGLSRDAAARFSFLLSIPAILGAAVYEFPKVTLVSGEAAASYFLGFLTAFIVGYAAISLVLRSLANRRFHWFGYYCLAVGGGVLVYVASALP